MYNRWLSLLLVFVFASAFPANVILAQQPMEIPKIEGPITLDGVPDEPAWEKLEPLPFTSYLPEAGKEPTERSDVRIGYTDEHLYVGARLYDSQPGLIQSTSYKRDAAGLINDFLWLILDTFNNNETALSFAVIPTGARTDISVFNDAQGDLPLNFDWNTFWDAETVQNSKGWFVEMRIPFSSLRYQLTGNKVTMGLIVMRWIARKNESAVFPAIPNKWGFFGQAKPSQAREVVFEDLENKTPIQIKPYLLGGLGQQQLLNNAGTSYRREDNFTYDAGLDVKYGIASNFTLDATVNTDFAQAEADNQQVNLTRFSLFFPEKRKFFQERSSLFDFRLEEQNRLFHSRRIGINQGDEIPILGGLRFTGNAGDWDLGFMNLQTGRKEAVSSENFGILRLKRKVFNPNSYAGAMFTSRVSREGSYNYAYGLDGIIQIKDDDYLNFVIAQTLAEGNSNHPISLDPTYLRVKWDTRKIEGFGYNLEYVRSGRDFNPGVGFLLRRNYTRIGNNLFYGWFADEDSPVINYKLSLSGRGVFRNTNGSTESAVFGPKLEINFKSGSFLNINPRVSYEDLNQDFEIFEGMAIPQSSYYYYHLDGVYNTASSGAFTTDISYAIGEFFDGYRWSGDVSPTWSVNPHLKLSGFYQVNHLKFPKRNDTFTAHIGRLRLEYYFSTELSASTFVQYSNADERITSNIRLRYNPREGNDLYIVYNEGLNTNRFSHNPVMPLSDQRTILVKYNYTFNY